MINLKTGDELQLAVSPKDIFGNVRYIPHQGQIEMLAARVSPIRFRTAAMGRRTGKSTEGGHELTVEAHRAFHMRDELEPKGNRQEFWIVGPEYTDSEKEFRVLYNDILRLGIPMDRPGTYYSETGSDALQLSLFGGRFLVKTKSAKYPGTLVGEGLSGVIMAEAAKMKEIVWTKYIRPMLADKARDTVPSWALLSSTPEGKNWFYRRYMDGQDPSQAEWWSMRLPSWSNNFLFPDGRQDPEILSMENDMLPEKFKQEIAADFTEFVGRVFKDFTEETHVGDFGYDPALPVFMASDKGFRAPSVVLFLQVDVWDNVFVIGEYYQPERTAEEVAQDILEDPKLAPLSRVARYGYPDPASPEWAATISTKLGIQMRGDTGGELQDRLSLIRRWLRPAPYELPDGHPEKVPKLLFDRHCYQTIREFNDYRYPETRDEATSDPSENPLKKDDHSPEALGRFFKGYFGPQVEETSRSRVSKARMRAKNG